MIFVSFCRLFFKINILKKLFQKHYQSVKKFRFISGQTNIGHDLGQNNSDVHSGS